MIVDWNIQILRKVVNRNFQEERVEEVGSLLNLRVMGNHFQGLKITKVSRTFRGVEKGKAFGSFACPSIFTLGG
jgi:hypothetical protein